MQSNPDSSQAPIKREDFVSSGRLEQILLKVSKKIADFETLDKILSALVDIIVMELDADRATIFLHDKESKELYSRIARGNIHHEIRIPDNMGVAGDVFSTGIGDFVNDVKSDSRFDPSIDEKIGFNTYSLLCIPITTANGENIGVVQVINKRKGLFTKDDLDLLDKITTQVALALKTTQIVENMKSARQREMELLDVVADITSEIDLGIILQKVMDQACKMLEADRATLFLNDEKTNELFSKIGSGLSLYSEIRLPNHLGIAGAVFTLRKTINIPYAYADLRFNPAFDTKTGFFTRSILCVPVANKYGKVIGVIQLLNKRRGAFTDEDEARLKTFLKSLNMIKHLLFYNFFLF